MVRKLINHGTAQNIRQTSDLTQKNQQATLSTTTMVSSIPPTTPMTPATIGEASIEAAEGK